MPAEDGYVSHGVGPGLVCSERDSPGSARLGAAGDTASSAPRREAALQTRAKAGG